MWAAPIDDTTDNGLSFSSPWCIPEARSIFSLLSPFPRQGDDATKRCCWNVVMGFRPAMRCRGRVHDLLALFAGSRDEEAQTET